MLGEQEIVEASLKAEEKIKQLTNDEIYRSQLREGKSFLEEELYKIYNRLMDDE